MVPRWLVGLLERVIPDDRTDDVIGDLEELHRRRAASRGRATALVTTTLEGGALVVVWSVRRSASIVASALGISRVELRLALRLLRKQPVMTLTSVVALGVGIGLVTGGFSVFRQALYGELPFPDADRWVNVESYDPESGARAPTDLERLRLFRDAAPAFAYLGTARTVEVNVVHDTGEVERIVGSHVTPATFLHLPYRPLAGRLPGPGDGRPGSPPVVLIRESLWERRYARDPATVGRPIDVAGVDHVVVGVLPDDAGYPSDGELWLPLDESALGAEGDREAVASRFTGILTPGATAESARRQLQQISDGVSAPGRGADPLRFRVTPLSRIMVTPQIHLAVVTFMTVLIAVLVVIAANVGNLVMARTSRRSRELAVRTALGASRSRIMGQLFAETLAMGFPAGVLGLVAAGAILEFYDGVLDELPFWVDLGLSPGTAATVGIVAVLATTIAAIVPALRATRRAPGDAIRGADRSSMARIGRVGGLMIATEVALSVALLGSALLFAEGFRRYVDPTFELPDDRVLTARIGLDLPPAAFVAGEVPDDSLARVLVLLDRSVSELPGVRAVAFASDLPRTTPWAEPLEVEGRGEAITAPVVRTTPGLLDLLGRVPTAGRDLVADDLGPDALPVALVTESFARTWFGSTDVVGRRLRPIPHDAAGTEPWRTIVGVVPDVMEVAGAGTGGVYLPLEVLRSVFVAVLVDGDPASFARPLRQAVYDLDPRLGLSDVVRLDDVGAENRSALAALSSGLTGIGVVTLLLSLAGVYSIVSLSVTRRTREIGVRVALGEARGAVLRSILQRSGLLLAGGAMAGAGAGWALARVRMFVFAVPEAEWWLFPALTAGVVFTGLLACWVPARRALSIHPVEALRHDG